jgi:hypothetical protein
MVLRKRLEALSSIHIYLRIINLWSWYLAAGFGAYGDVMFVVKN